MLVIGLDPGVDTGYAIWSVPAARLTVVESMKIHVALERVRGAWVSVDHRPEALLVMFEDARKRRWFGKKGRESLQGAGSVKRDCTIWQDFLNDLGVPYVATPPLAGATKWTAEHFARTTGWPGRTNEHSRDAACRVFQLNEPQVRAMIREWEQRR